MIENIRPEIDYTDEFYTKNIELSRKPNKRCRLTIFFTCNSVDTLIRTFPNYIPIYLPTHIHTYIQTYYIPTYLHTVATYLPAYIP